MLFLPHKNKVMLYLDALDVEGGIVMRNTSHKE
jgi:hypothetical protein